MYTYRITSSYIHVYCTYNSVYFRGNTVNVDRRFTYKFPVKIDSFQNPVKFDKNQNITRKFNSVDSEFEIATENQIRWKDSNFSSEANFLCDSNFASVVEVYTSTDIVREQ